MEEKPRQLRGFALLNPEQRREVAAVGGRASHKSGKGHEWTKEAAKIAGRKGGKASHGRRVFEVGDRVSVLPGDWLPHGATGRIEVVDDCAETAGVERMFGVVLDAAPGEDRKRAVFPESRLNTVPRSFGK